MQTISCTGSLTTSQGWIAQGGLGSQVGGGELLLLHGVGLGELLQLSLIERSTFTSTFAITGSWKAVTKAETFACTNTLLIFCIRFLIPINALLLQFEMVRRTQ